MRQALRTLALPLAFLVIALPAGVATVMAMGGDDKKDEESGFTPISQGDGKGPQRRAQARWEKVTTLTGEGSAERQFSIADGAIQWKASWKCQSGKLRMAVGEGTEDGDVLADANCPDAGEERSTGHGPGKVHVDASGPWRMSLQQQVDTELKEPPLAGMTKDALLSRGRFHPVQKPGEGTVSLYALKSGRLALRFENFYTAASPGLEVWLSRADDVRSTLDAREAEYTDAGTPRSTWGSYNQMLPRGVNASEIHSIVIWCPTVTIAFTAAPLSD